MHATKVLEVLRTHLKDDEAMITPAIPLRYFRADHDIPGRNYPAGYHAKLAMSDAWFDRHLEIVQAKMRHGLPPAWMPRRRTIGAKKT